MGLFHLFVISSTSAADHLASKFGSLFRPTSYAREGKAASDRFGEFKFEEPMFG